MGKMPEAQNFLIPPRKYMNVNLNGNLAEIPANLIYVFYTEKVYK